MIIACIAWGSLVWDPRNLPVVRKWHEDGPLLPIEFTRQSRDGRLTLVLTPGVQCVRALWTIFLVATIDEAISALQLREGIPEKKTSLIGLWQRGMEGADEHIKQWALSKGLDAALWTALPSKFKGTDGLCPTQTQALQYLRGLDYNTRQHAERYVRATPLQIDTAYRRSIEFEFGWTPQAPFPGSGGHK